MGTIEQSSKSAPVKAFLSHYGWMGTFEILSFIGAKDTVSKPLRVDGDVAARILL